MNTQKLFIGLVITSLTIATGNRTLQEHAHIGLPAPDQISAELSYEARQYAAGIFVQGVIFPDKPDEPTKDQYSEQQISLILSYQ